MPANRIGYGAFTLTQLKILQECITLVVSTIFSFVVFKEPIRWNALVSYGFLIGAAYFALRR